MLQRDCVGGKYKDFLNSAKSWGLNYICYI